MSTQGTAHRGAQIWEVVDPDDEVAGLLPDGSPDPAYAAALGLLSAPLSRRAAAAAIDLGMVLLLHVPAWFLAWPLLLKLLRDQISWFGFSHHPDRILTLIVMSATLGLTLIYCLASLFFHGARGLTLGKALVGLRTVNVRTLAKPGVGRALVRVLVTWLPAVTVIGPVVVLASPCWDSSGRRRGWADLAAGTWLVDINDGLNPYDDKRMRIASKSYHAVPVDPRAPLPNLTVTEEGASYRPAGRVSAGVLGSTAPADLRGTPSAPRARTPLIPESYQPPVHDAAPAAPPAPVESGPVESAPNVASAWSQPAPVARRAAEQPLLLVLDTGERIEMSWAILLGRGPEVTESTPGATPVAIADTTYSVSKTHVLLRRSAEGVEVTDLASTNGTFVVRGGIEHALASGQSALAGVGDTIRFGDRTLVVHRSGQEQA